MVKQNSIIRTTVNVRSDIHILIKHLSEKYDKEPGLLMKLYLERMISKLMKTHRFRNHAIQYQEQASEWAKPHLLLDQAEYDRFLDVKKVFRLSLSLILAMAVEYFGEAIFPKTTKYSYPEFLYKKEKFENEYYIRYVFTWKKRGKTPG